MNVQQQQQQRNSVEEYRKKYMDYVVAFDVRSFVLYMAINGTEWVKTRVAYEGEFWMRRNLYYITIILNQFINAFADSVVIHYEIVKNAMLYNKNGGKFNFWISQC